MNQGEMEDVSLSDAAIAKGFFLVDLIMGKATDDEEAAEEGGRLTCPAFL